jgi:glycosyltransferase involved in cell wall biosynthesis
MSSVEKSLDPLKVLWITPNLCGAAGGPTSTVVNGLIAEKEGGMQSDLATTGSPDQTDDRGALKSLEKAGVKVHLFRRTGPPSASAAWGLSPGLTFWLIRNIRRYDVLHLQYVWCWTTILGCTLGNLYRVPVVLTPHESLTNYDIEIASRSHFKRTMKVILRKFVIGSVDQLLLMSWLEERDTESGGVPIHRVPHAIIITAKPCQDPGSKVTSPRARRQMKIGFMGRPAPKKGIDRLIRAFWLSNDSCWSLELAGPLPESSLTTEYRELADQLGVGKSVRWMGFVEREKRDEFLANLDVLVMPSEYETFGMVAAEAMSVGTPVIVSRESGIAPLVEESGGGIVVDRPDPERLCEALVAFAADPGRWKRAGASAREAIERTHSPAAFSARTAQVYEAALDSRKAPRSEDP